VKPTSGTITLDGQDITQLNELERAGIITRLFQNTRLNSVGSMTVLENLAMAHYSRRNARLANGTHTMPREKVIALVDSIAMNHTILDKQMQQLSGGQRQLIAFIMSTQLIPKLLLLDEPTAALDPQASTKLLSFAAQFIRQHAVTSLLITHDPHIALSLGNKIWILENGTITKQYKDDEKKRLNPDKLIGQIDYAALAQ
jgi:putative ABC transport system ATP-binding protein